MKRIIAASLLCCMFFSACGFFEERIIEPVTFYYLKSEYDFGRNPSVIVSEEREASGHRDDLSYLLALYLMGPANEEYKSPLPSGARILKPQHQGNSVRLDLLTPSYTFNDSEFSLACACLTLTCLDITGADEVTITYMEQSVTMTRQSLTLIDDTDTIFSEEDSQ